jgi:hypothetical protein
MQDLAQKRKVKMQRMRISLFSMAAKLVHHAQADWVQLPKGLAP